MPTLPTLDDLLGQGQNEIQSRNPELTDFEEGSNLDAVNGGSAVQADEAIGVLVQLFGDLFFGTAEGAALDTLVLDRFGTALARKQATASVGEVTVTTTAALVPAGTRVEAIVDGETITVETDANATKAAGPGSVIIAATAQQTGRQGNIAAGTATSLLDAIPGDPSATVTNAERFAGGSDAETDQELRDRVVSFALTLRRGTIEALRTGALTVDGVLFATVDESTVALSDFVSLYIGDPDGAGNAVLAALVDAEEENWRAAGIDVRTFAAAREEIAQAITVTVKKGSNQSALTTLIEAAVIEGYMDTIAAGETWYASKSEAQVHGVDRTQVRGAQVTNPATQTLAPTLPQNALRTLTAALTLTFVEEA